MFKLRCEWGFRFARSRMCIWLSTSFCCVPSVVAFIKLTLGLRACHFVFMFEYPTGLKKLFFTCNSVFCKFVMKNKGKENKGKASRTASSKQHDTWRIFCSRQTRQNNASSINQLERNVHVVNVGRARTGLLTGALFFSFPRLAGCYAGYILLKSVCLGWQKSDINRTLQPGRKLVLRSSWC